jgi:hypothetical protein
VQRRRVGIFLRHVLEIEMMDIGYRFDTGGESRGHK